MSVFWGFKWPCQAQAGSLLLPANIRSKVNFKPLLRNHAGLPVCCHATYQEDHGLTF